MKTTTVSPFTSTAAPTAEPANTIELSVHAATAAELMTRNPISMRAHGTVPEALALLTDHGFSAVPVINREGHPIGVLSRTDLVRFERERIEYLQRNPATFDGSELTLPSGESLDSGFQVESGAAARVDEVMTPKVLSVQPETPTIEVIRLMVEKQVHRLFVVDATGVLVGVISTMDILRRLIS